MAKLTDKQQKFCNEYMIDLNATQAAIRTGYSKKTSYSIGQRLLKKVECQEYLQILIESTQKRNQITLDIVVKELANTLMVRVCDFYNNDGSVKLLSELSDEQKSALSYYGVKKIKVPEDVDDGNGGTKIKYVYQEFPVFKTHDRDKNADMLMKYFGGYEKDNTQSKQETTVIIAKEPEF